MHRVRRLSIYAASIVAGSILIGCATCAAAQPGSDANVLHGASAFSDYTNEGPGTLREITVADLPQPYATTSVDNGPKVVPRPASAWPQTLPGFKVELYASQLENPREIRTAPDGDIFLAESDPGRIMVFHGLGRDGRPETTSVFATGLTLPFGI